MKILSPAYGRDYKAAAMAVKDYKNGLYFVLETPQIRQRANIARSGTSRMKKSKSGSTE